MNRIPINFKKYLCTFPVLLLLCWTILIPSAAIRVHGDSERTYDEITGHEDFKGDIRTYTSEYSARYGKKLYEYTGVDISGGRMDWKIKGWFLYPLKLDTVRDTEDIKDYTSTSGHKNIYFAYKDYEGYVSSGDTIQFYASVQSTQGPLEIRMIVSYNDETPEKILTAVYPADFWSNGLELPHEPAAGKTFSAETEAYTIEENVDHILIDFRMQGSLDLESYQNYYFTYKLQVTDEPQEITTSADTAAGEDSGVDFGGTGSDNGNSGNVHSNSLPSGSDYTDDITSSSVSDDFPGMVAVSIGGAVAAGAAIAAGAGGRKNTGSRKKNKNKDKKGSGSRQKKIYRMYVSKNFGDAIPKGHKPLEVSARIAEIVNGQPVPCPQLSKQIRISGERLNITERGFDGNYRTAKVSAPNDTNDETGVVAFACTVDGTVFRRNVIFRLTGMPRIVFPDSSADGRGWVINADRNETDVVRGMGGHASIRFLFLDAASEPEKISFTNTDGFEIKAVKDSQYSYTYYAEIDNFTADKEKEAGIFADPEYQKIGIHAVFPDSSSADSEFFINIYPGGISVPTEYADKGAIRMDTLPDPQAVGYTKIPPAMFNVFVCYVKDNQFIMERNPTLTWKGFLDEGQYGNMFSKNFEYKIENSAMISVYPLYTLPMLKDPYEASLEISFEKNGFAAHEVLPFHLYGEIPDTPSTAEWETAYSKLKRDIVIFGLGNDKYIRTMVRNAPAMSAADIEYVRFWVIASGKIFYEKQNREYKKIDEVMTNYIVAASAIVKIGDKATEYAIKLAWPNAPAELIASFANPWKNAMAEFLGQYVSRVSWIDLGEGTIDDFEFGRTLVKSSQDALTETITGDYTINPKVMGKFVSLYLMVCFAQHYFYGEGKEKGDIFKSTIAALSDLTLAKLKTFVKNQLKVIGKKYGPKIGQFVGKRIGDVMRKGAEQKAKDVGMSYFNTGVRKAYETTGKSLTNAGYKMAKALKDSASKEFLQAANKDIDQTVKAISDTSTYLINTGLAQVLNYLLKGSKKDNESLGITLDELATEYAFDRKEEIASLLAEGIKITFGLDVEKAYKTAEEELDISVVIDGNLLIMKMFGYAVEIKIMENIENMADIIYEYCFSWMEELWNTKQNRAPEYDPRDEQSEDPYEIERQASRIREMETMTVIKYVK